MSNTPQIRFAGFTDAWEQRELRTAATFSKGSGYSKNDLIENGTPIILYGRLYTKYETVISEVDTFVDVQPNSVYSTGHEVIVPASGETAEDISRASFVAKSGILLGGDLNIIVPDDYINPVFLALTISNGNQQKELSKRAQGKSVVHIHNSDLENVVLLYPKYEEQEKIGEYFSKLDSLITLHQRKCDALQKFKKSMLQKMFPQNGESVPEIRFAGFTDAWEQRKLEEVITVGNGMDYKHLSEGDIPVYGTGGYMLSVDKALSYDKDAIGIGRKGTIDKPYVLKAPFWTVDTLFYCIPKEDYSLDFVYCIFQNVNWKEKDESTGVPSLSKVNINSTDVKAPTLAEQEKIGAYFSQLDNLITLHQRKLETLQKMKKSLLQKMFV